MWTHSPDEIDIILAYIVPIRNKNPLYIAHNNDASIVLSICAFQLGSESLNRQYTPFTTNYILIDQVFPLTTIETIQY